MVLASAKTTQEVCIRYYYLNTSESGATAEDVGEGSVPRKAQEGPAQLQHIVTNHSVRFCSCKYRNTTQVRV